MFSLHSSHVKTSAYTPKLCLYIDYIKSYVSFSKSSNVSNGHLGFMQIKNIPQSCHSGKRWIWLLEALSNTNPSKKLTVPTISGFHFWLLDYVEFVDNRHFFKAIVLFWLSLSFNIFLRQLCAFYTLLINCFAVFELVSFAVLVLVSLHSLHVRCISL